MGAGMGREQYRQITHEHFPEEISLKIGPTTLIYHKQVYKIKPEEGEAVESGLRYGENPGQEAALYRLVNGHLTQPRPQ